MDNASVRMRLDSLAEIPAAVLPPWFSLRPYRTGDRETWVQLYSAAEPFLTITPEIFDREFRGEESALRQRMLFLIAPNGQCVGTSTAWYDDLDHDPRCGRVHWVAIHPAFQGRGLAKPLLTRTLQTLRELGHDHAYLLTSTGRIPAITLYLRYGFLPDIRSDAEAQAWTACAAALRPALQGLVAGPGHGAPPSDSN